MKRALVLCIVAASIGAASTIAFAQESPELQLEFVRKLRAKGYHDLVAEYILQLEKSQPQLAGQLGLERARSLVAMAREKSLDQRSALFNQARELFQDFVKKYEGKPEAAQARLEMAKLVAYHGHAILAKAIRDNEDPKDQHEAARKAEQLFIQAGQELDTVIKQLQDKEQTQAKFDRAVSYIDQARTYLDLSKDANNRKRSELIDEAKKAFLGLATDESSDVGLLANAWLVKCYEELQDPQAVEKHLKRVVEAKTKSIPAERLARYFYIQWIKDDPKVKLKYKTALDQIKLIEAEANKWIKDYGPAAAKTWEGQGVRMELADALLAQAKATAKGDLKAASVAGLVNQAEKIYASISELDSDFSEEAKRRTIFIAVTKLEGKKLEDIHDFESSLLKGYYERQKAIETGRKLDDAKPGVEQKKLEAAKKQHMRDAIRSVVQALAQATPSTPLPKLDEARFLLMGMYFGSGDLYRAAVAGEALGRGEGLGGVKAPTKNAPRGIGGAFLAYDALGQKDEAIRGKTRELAEYVLRPEVQKFWANEPITSVARHHLAMLHKENKEYKEAIALLEQLSPDFPGYVYAQGQLAFLALAAAKDTNAKLTDEERRAFRAKARQTIKRMPATLPPDTDANTALMYYLAEMEEAKFLYSDAAEDLKVNKLAEAEQKYKQMGKFVEQHFEVFKKSPVKLEDKQKENLTTLMTVLGKYSKLGLADVQYRLGRYDQVLSFELVGPLVQQMKDKAAKIKEGKIREKDNIVIGDILGLALRTYVQKSDLDNAKAVFDILERLAPEDDAAAQGGESINMMFALVKDIEEQIARLKKDSDPEKLKAAKENFGKFIEGIAESTLKKSSEPSAYMFLANAYAILDEPQKAADLYAKIPEPKALNAKKVEEQDLKEVQKYWFLQLQYAKALRQGKDFKKAWATCERLINHPNGQYLILAEMEKNFVLEDSDRIGTAIKGWNALMNRLRERAGQDFEIKQLYFDCYFYNARCWYKYSQSAKVLKDGKEEQFLNSAARYIVNLENAKNKEGWEMVRDKFIDLMDMEPKLKKAYEKLKSQAAPTAAGAR